MTFKASISDETFSFHEHPFHDRRVTGAQIAEAIHAHPLGDFLVIRQLPSLELEALRPTELADLEDSTRFFVVRGTDAYGFEVDGLSMVWPQKALTGLTVKRLVMKDGADVELRLEREDEADRIIGDHDPVQLTDEGLESFKTRPARAAVTIVVEGTPHRWQKEAISYAEVVTLECPITRCTPRSPIR